MHRLAVKASPKLKEAIEDEISQAVDGMYILLDYSEKQFG
jgi:hypothetical protein